ncbi:phosphoribosylaminoimidazole carboxylase [Fistulina hepatica ATCC 64428]|uniref:Phosphoribosylaminoimidazole carboxylase n=1 Tax=Fistulina hepatica ATCC 64428 TaxID=1128425 RepID=A0A0D7AKM6_9AGAR|nr:phosphoribosylaminoimidazole carboxylase [Fistulina hepatica ATCC 64428]
MYTVGVLGGGQLGRMLGEAASRLNIRLVVLDEGDSPAKQILAHDAHIDGSFQDASKIAELASKVDAMTIEIEHVNVNALDAVPPSVPVHPSPRTIRIIQDKFLQKRHFREAGCPLGEFIAVDSTVSAIKEAARVLGLPLMLKARTLAYDGRGNYVLRSADDTAIQTAISALGGCPLYAEKWVPFVSEIAVMVVRSRDGEVCAYPAVETVHKKNICHLVFAPLRNFAFNATSTSEIAVKAQKVAADAVSHLWGAGVFGVELFLLPDGDVLINEVAPRPHNSGHYTIEACYTSQYENHLRAVLGLPLGTTELKVGAAAMVNLLGFNDSMKPIEHLVGMSLSVPGATTHLYGKSTCRKGRKMGHITVVGPHDAAVRERVSVILRAMEKIEAEVLGAVTPQILAPKTRSHPHPLVGVIMGSDSDLAVMRDAAHILDRFKVPYELTIVSAHRTPDRLTNYARSAVSRGLRVIISGAGGAAHLSGMVAAMTPLPVIGVPVKGSRLDGVDSLYSMVQMPRGVPVATVAINNSTNAGLLAVRILSTGILQLGVDMETYMRDMERQVMEKVGRLEEIGWDAYIA